MKTVVLVWSTVYDFGLGDLVKGSIFMHQLSKKMNFPTL